MAIQFTFWTSIPAPGWGAVKGAAIVEIASMGFVREMVGGGCMKSEKMKMIKQQLIVLLLLFILAFMTWMLLYIEVDVFNSVPAAIRFAVASLISLVMVFIVCVFDYLWEK